MILPIPRPWLCGTLALFAMLPTGNVRAQGYSMTYLGTLDSSHEGATTSINASGFATGFSRAGSESRAFLYSPDGKLTNLGTLAGDSASSGAGINAAARVAGTSSRTVESNLVTRAFLTNAQNKPVNLGTLTANSSSSASAVNDSGVVVGVSGDVAFGSANGQLTNLGTLANASVSEASAINNAGRIVGTSGPEVVRFNGGGSVTILGSPAGAVAVDVCGINEAGVVVGSYQLVEGGQSIAFVRSANGTFTDLAAFNANTTANDINNAGQIVGASGNRAFLSVNGTMTDLNTLVTFPATGAGFVELIRAYSINDAGRIAGQGRYRDASGVIQFRAFILTPFAANTAVTPVISPETGTYESTVVVSISSATVGAVIRYTTNGTDPTSSSQVYTGPFIVSSTRTIKARAFATGLSPSNVATARYTITSALTNTALPTISPRAGTYPRPLAVTISTSTPGALLRYTTDGSEPTPASRPYTEPFSLTKSATVKAKAFATDVAPSPTLSVSYVVTATNPNAVAKPRIQPNGGTFVDKQRVTLSCATAGAVIFYTLDGTVPTVLSSRYSSSFVIRETSTVSAIAYLGSFRSAVATATFTKAP